MADIELKSAEMAAPDAPTADRLRPPEAAPRRRSRIRVLLPFLITLIVVAIAAGFGQAMWRVYMVAPWTRDGTVRAYVVTMAPQIAGQIVQLPVADNQLVHKGDLLLVIDPTDYRIAVDLAQAAVEQAQANAHNVEREAQRRQELTRLSVTKEEKQTYESNAVQALAAYQQAVARLNQAQVNLRRTEIRSPVNGYVTNLLAQLGDYATVGQNLISLVDADSFWVDGYFEETSVDRIRKGDLATIKLMGYSQPLHGHVDSIARAINVANAQPNREGLASVNPIFTWVRLAQRIPVRIHIDAVPKSVHLVAGMTATVQIDPRSGAAR
jgi:RND family efflux transporter MFP subunit